MQIIFVCAEVSPWVRVGGLSEVMHSLPEALARQGHRVLSIAPRYSHFSDVANTNHPIVIDTDGGKESLDVYHTKKGGVDRVFVDHPIFFSRRQPDDTGYGPHYGIDWDDNPKAFSMLCNAALRVIQNVPLGSAVYGEEVIIVANDWHAALIPIYIRAEREACGAWMRAKVCVLIHNFRYQGIFSKEANLSRLYNLPQRYIDSMVLENGECVSWLKGGIVWADRVLTVSPSYASELVNSPPAGRAIVEDLVRNGVFGIPNGVNTTDTGYLNSVNASFDSIASHIDETCLFKKSLLKKIVQHQVGLTQDPTRPLFLYLGLIDRDKGLDVALEAFAKYILPTFEVGLLVAGTGDTELIDLVDAVQSQFPDKIAVDKNFRDYDTDCRNRYLGAADWILLPSRVDPCSLLHFEAMKFGALPMVTPIGGFKDTVSHLNNGVVLRDCLEPFGDVSKRSRTIIAEAVLGVMKLSQNQSFISAMQRAAMHSARSEHSWDVYATVYSKVFSHLLSVG